MCTSLTGKAAIRDLQVWSDVRRTRMCGVDDVVGHPVSTVLSSGAQHLNVFQDVGLTVDIAEWSLDAAADPHATVQGFVDQQDLSAVTRDVQKLSVADLDRHVYNIRPVRTQNSPDRKPRRIKCRQNEIRSERKHIRMMMKICDHIQQHKTRVPLSNKIKIKWFFNRTTLSERNCISNRSDGIFVLDLMPFLRYSVDFFNDYGFVYLAVLNANWVNVKAMKWLFFYLSECIIWRLNAFGLNSLEILCCSFCKCGIVSLTWKVERIIDIFYATGDETVYRPWTLYSVSKK